MNINIQYVEIAFSEKITQYIVETLNILKSSYPWISGANVSFTLTATLTAEFDEVKETCEIELKIPGLSLFVSSIEDKCEMAARETALQLNKLLQKRKKVLRAR